MSSKFVSVGQLFKQDLDTAYILPVFPSSYCKTARFVNKDKFRFYDNPPSCKTFQDAIFPQLFYPVLGDELFVLTDNRPPDCLTQHWQKWLPVFKPAKYIGIDEGLNNHEIPIVTLGPFEGIPSARHFVDPDVLHRIHSKSAIPEIGVPCPRHMDRRNVDFPFVVKTDFSFSCHGVDLAKNESELSCIIEKFRKNGWNGEMIFQEYISDIKDIVGINFYVQKTGEVQFLGAYFEKFNGFKFHTLSFNCNDQEHLRNEVYDEFVIPISQYLHKSGFFGVVNIEIIITSKGEKKLVDLNARFPGELTSILAAPYMADLGFTSCSFSLDFLPIVVSAETLVAKANHLNESKNVGRVLVVAVGNGDDSDTMLSIAIYAKTSKDCELLSAEMKSSDACEVYCPQ